MANINRRWHRILAVGCSHGHLADKKAQQAVLDFKRDWKPKWTFELGDFLDTTAFRAGARGTKDEAEPIEPDLSAGLNWLRALEPTHVCLGNHEDRLVKLREHPNAIVSHCAGVVYDEVLQTIGGIKAQWRPYDIDEGWFEMGGVLWGHGYMFGVNALRDHAETFGSCVIAHLHKPGVERGRVRGRAAGLGPIARCVGTLSTVSAMGYMKAKKARLSWGAGAVAGEVCDDEARLWVCEGYEGRWAWPQT